VLSRRASALLLAGALSACTTGTTPSEHGAEEPGVITTDLEAPWSIAFRGSTALISQRDGGQVLELADDGTTRQIGTVPDMASRGEGGLLGIAVQEEYLYAYFTGADDNRIARFELTGDPGALALGVGSVILDGIPAGSNHNGGRIAFGPDGMLYATTGDAGDQSAAQDLQSLGGKILRITPDGDVPGDNPFPNSPVFTSGHRNPQGIGWDSDGRMYASEFGQDTWDELNVIEAGGNYGWPEVEGIADQDGFIDPVQQWSTADASPSGLAVTEDAIVIAALRGERLIEVPLDDLGSSSAHLVGDHGRLRDVVVTPDGDLWVLTNNTDGRGDPGAQDDLLLEVEL
jgi:glucose/arabinose dehydrogenase